jgi:hypothetical protein
MVCSSGIATIRSGRPIRQPSVKTGGAGRSFGLPSFAPWSTQAEILSISAWLNAGLFSNVP